MMRYIVYFFVLVSVLFIAACNEQQKETNTISGKLNLLLHRQEPVGLYLRFELKENGDNAAQVNIASSGFNKISEHPVIFSLAFPPEMIDQQKHYRLSATLAEDPLGEKEIASMSAPVLTQGNPSTLTMAMQPVVEPIE